MFCFKFVYTIFTIQKTVSFYIVYWLIIDSDYLLSFRHFTRSSDRRDYTTFPRCIFVRMTRIQIPINFIATSFRSHGTALQILYPHPTLAHTHTSCGWRQREHPRTPPLWPQCASCRCSRPEEIFVPLCVCSVLLLAHRDSAHALVCFPAMPLAENESIFVFPRPFICPSQPLVCRCFFSCCQTVRTSQPFRPPTNHPSIVRTCGSGWAVYGRYGHRMEIVHTGGDARARASVATGYASDGDEQKQFSHPPNIHSIRMHTSWYMSNAVRFCPSL